MGKLDKKIEMGRKFQTQNRNENKDKIEKKLNKQPKKGKMLKKILNAKKKHEIENIKKPK